MDLISAAQMSDRQISVDQMLFFEMSIDQMSILSNMY